MILNLDDDIKRYKPPVRNAGDVGHAIIRAGLGAIPYAGAAAVEILNLIVMPSLEKRRDEWMESVGRALETIENKMGIVLKSLGQNDSFIDTALEASRIALKTSNHEKREFLRNAILNSALPNPPEEALQQIFLSSIDTLSVWHFRLLEFLSHQLTYPDTPENDKQKSDVLIKHFPELKEKGNFIEFVWNDLSSRGLIVTDRSDLYGSVQHRTTEIGNLLLDFVKNPIDETR